MVSPDIQRMWRAFPLRIPGGSKCDSCQEETVLVQSMTGGFVTRNCPQCNKPSTLPFRTFRQLSLWVACPQCKRRMAAVELPDKNYGFRCDTCDVGVPLFSLLPFYTDL
jgi:ssDNA-binding Zn-finger/Zn-ribbon topoisomerase 1